ncbi:MAG: hypothetical protein WC399_01265 [Bacilli bacterium]|jgi:hypothetical protein
MNSRIIENAKLSLATLAFIASVGSLIIGTVAWFASSNYLELANFKIAMGEAEQVEIGLVVPEGKPNLGEAESIVYYETVTDEMLLNHEYYQPGTTLKAVSSMFQSQWLSEETDLTDPDLYPVLRSHYLANQSRTDSVVAHSNFYQFEIYIRSTVRIDLYLDEGTYLMANETKNQQAAYKYGLDAAKLNQVDQAMRVSFLTPEQFAIWEPNTDVVGTTEFGGRLDVYDYDNYFDYDYDTKLEYMFGEYNADAYLVYDESARTVAVTEFSSFAANTAEEAIPLSIPMSKQNGLVIQRESSVTKHYLTDQTNPDAALMRLYPNEPQRMVVTAYAEGWDRDTTNAINFANFSLNLVFGGIYAPL